MKIFSYGSKRVKYNTRNIYVESVDSLHDLTFYEKRLDARGVPWAVFVEVTQVDKERSSTKFVLVAEETHD